MQTHLSRRRFLQTSTAGAAGLVILSDSRSAAAAAANEKLNIAGIGVGGQGAGDVGAAGSGNNIVALCDVDARRAAGTFKRFPAAKQYQDFRKMLDEMHAQIDAVVVATPDHTHAVAAVAAMKLGKHIYCEKPLTRTVYESHLMRQTAAKHKVVTQMGNQGSASEALRRAVELAWAGTCGELRECHVWLANGDGPQERPKDTPPVPAGLDWDLWLGPAPHRPYHPCYLPGSWRRWRAFGSGGGGDMGCHTINMAFRALRLDLLWNPDPAEKPEKPPVIRVEAEASEIHPETYPRTIKAQFDIPARGKLPPLKLHWYNGGLKPPKEVLRGYTMTQWGCLVGGDKAAILSSCPWNTRFLMLPEAEFKDFKGPEKTIPRSPGHHAEWIRACKGGPKAFSNFDIGAPMNEIVHLVHVATLAGKPIEYDPQGCKILNAPEANPLLHRDYRAGWTL
ncbi:MAG TPA: Gfo/Idh/MocA family oxidoreductase [Planctomycetota bacterium]|nr:Gfo/Idh/MocA family oxidoreductase [Planctomycetota bacterium]